MYISPWQMPLCEGSPKGRRAGVCFLGYFFCTSKRSNSPAGEKGNCKARKKRSKQSKLNIPTRSVGTRVKSKSVYFQRRNKRVRINVHLQKIGGHCPHYTVSNCWERSRRIFFLASPRMRRIINIRQMLKIHMGINLRSRQIRMA